VVKSVENIVYRTILIDFMMNLHVLNGIYDYHQATMLKYSYVELALRSNLCDEHVMTACLIMLPTKGNKLHPDVW